MHTARVLLVAGLLAVCHADANAKMERYHKRVGKKFLTTKAAESDVHELPSGLLFKVLEKGSGKSPEEGDQCDVHYKGTLKYELLPALSSSSLSQRYHTSTPPRRDGTQFDSSYDRGSPTTFAPNQVIKGWTEALQLMCEGDVWELYIPYDLAYGERGSPPKIPGFSPLVFKIELITVKKGGKECSVAKAKLSVWRTKNAHQHAHTRTPLLQEHLGGKSYDEL